MVKVMHQTFTLSEIFLAILDLLPTAKSKSPRVAKSALCEEPDKGPWVKDNYVGLALNYWTVITIVTIQCGCKYVVNVVCGLIRLYVF